jgi:protein-tyrosine phosphatase
MTDLHCHILHDIDDGPATLGESVDLCRIAWDNHIERIVATPHITAVPGMDDFLKTRDARLDELKKALVKLDIRVDIFAGAEVYVTDEMIMTRCLEQLTLHHSRYLLAELPQTETRLPQLMGYLDTIKSRRLIPIIAHPERYVYFQRDNDMLNILLDRGALLQVNAASLCRPGDRAIYNLAKKIVRSRAASFLATDAHSVVYRPNNLLHMLSCISDLDIDFDYLDALVNLNPNIVLQDKTLN